MRDNPANSRVSTLATRSAWILALALAAGPMACAQQDAQQRQDQPQEPVAKQPVKDDRPPVISRDTLPGTRADQDSQNEAQQPEDQPSRRPMRGDRPNGPALRGQLGVAARPVPDALTLPAGTVLQIRTNDYLSSDDSKAGQHFTAILEQPLVVNGWVVARRGGTIEGQVESAKKAGRVKGVSQLGLQLTDLTLVDGQVAPVQTEMWQGSGGTSHGRDAATIATTTGLGAAIGAAANLGTGAAVGAGAGLLTGIGAVLLTRGRPTILEPETPLTFRLTEAVTINTAEGKQAYLPVRQGDFDNGRGRRPLRPYAVGYPVPGPYYCGYYAPCFAPTVYGGYYRRWRY